MDKKLIFSFDKEGDILDISIGKPRKAVSEEIKNDVFVRKDPKTKEIVGFMILNFERRFKKLGKAEEIPLKAVFSY